MKQEAAPHRSFADQPDERKVELFYNAIQIISELLDSPELYGILHEDFELTDEEIRSHSFMNDIQLMAAGAIISQPHENNICVSDVLYKTSEDYSLCFVHEQGSCDVTLDALLDSNAFNHRHYGPLLDAHVIRSRAREFGTELVVDGIESEKLNEFQADYVAQMEALRDMSPVM